MWGVCVCVCVCMSTYPGSRKQEGARSHVPHSLLLLLLLFGFSHFLLSNFVARRLYAHIGHS